MQITMYGKVVRDFEEVTAKNGKIIWKLGISTPAPDRKKLINNEDKEKNEGKFANYYWVNGYFFNDAYLKLSPYITKGKWVFLYGQLRLHPYLNRDGEPKTWISVFVDRIELVPNTPNEGEIKIEGEPQKPKESSPSFNPESPSIHQLYPHENKIKEENTTTEPFFQFSTTDYSSQDIYYGNNSENVNKENESLNKEDYLFDDVPF